MDDEAELLGAALALGARDVPGWSEAEEHASTHAVHVPVADLRARILSGEDPLGEAFSRLRTPSRRRALGATYTPPWLVATMLDWARPFAPDRVVDPGVGSARFLVAAGRAFPNAHLLGIEVDPLAATLARAHLAAAGFAHRAEVRLVDYCDLELERGPLRTLFLGNPPYVRHHAIPRDRKAWLTRAAAELGLPASQLAGLHAHFFLATARLARPGDVGCFVTAAEWLDVNYGALPRALLAGPLGLRWLRLLDPSSAPFPDATTTAVITGFVVGDTGPVDVGRVIPRERLAEPRWTPLLREARPAQGPTVELGELFRVHRGQVTGANDVWIVDDADLPEEYLFPSVTRARELFAAGPALTDLSRLRKVVDLPADLPDHPGIERFLASAKSRGADQGWIARNRRPWWRVGLRAPAPILATYMARRPPAFVRNPAGARHVNIAHGLYPRAELAPERLDRIAAWLTSGVDLADGRVYAGGLTKFEPREMERIRIPLTLVE